MTPTPPAILIVDDEPILRESMAAYLEDSGYDVTQAHDGASGLTLFRRMRPGLVLLDLRMPGMDGLEVLETMAREAPDVPVIVVTGAGVLEDAVAALKLGALDFVTKPILDMQVLEHAVDRGLERARLLEENQRYHEHLESEIQRRTADLADRSAALATANEQLKAEMAVRLRSEQALKDSEAKLADVVALFEGYIYTCDRDYRLGFMNRRLARAVGGDAIGKPCHQVLYGLTVPCDWCPNPQVMEGEATRLELQSPRDRRWYYAMHSPIVGSDGQVAQVQVMVIDITDRKAAEQALQARAATLREENRRLRSSIRGTLHCGDIIGKSHAMQAVYETIFKAAESSANVIIYGESGTGKELVAHTIHRLSQRGGKPFVTVHCGAIPDNLMESEFFGYRKGAFTGAAVDKPGYLASADKGTLFMDEIGELNVSLQVKLLRAIEGGGYTPVGGNQVQRTDIRIVAATNRDLKEQVRQKKFRKDFFYRIHIIPIHLPPLRDRKEDIPLLVHHFLQQYTDKPEARTIPNEVMRAMQRHDWPGNVRELQNAVHRYITLHEFDAPSSATPEVPISLAYPEDQPVSSLHQALSRFEKSYLRQVLEAHKWHRSRAAHALGIDRRTLFRKIKSYGL